MTDRFIQKALIAHEDLALGQGPVEQTRNGQATAVEQIDLPWTVTTLTKLTQLDTALYFHALLDTATQTLLYRFDATSAEVADSYNYVAPLEGSGQWVLVQDMRKVANQTVADYTAFKTASYEDGDIVEVAYRDASTQVEGSGGSFYVSNADFTIPKSNDPEEGIYVDLGSGITAIRRFVDRINTTFFGSVNAADNTLAIQSAMNYTSWAKAGTIYIDVPTSYISIAASGSTTACLEIPDGVTLKGLGRDSTTVQRLISERGTDGVLLVNKDYDTTGNYGAAGNIVIEGFTLTDGAVSPVRALGDLIGLGHGKNITVRGMHFGNHDQHAVDIASCSGVYIYNNTGINNATVTENSAATLQVDCANGLGIWGLLVTASGTYAPATEDIQIYGNDLQNHKAAVIQIGHAEWSRYQNIIIRDNPRLSGGYTSTVDAVIHLDENRRWAHLKTLKILNNGLQGNHSGSTLINLFSEKDLSTYDDIEIAHNYGVTKGQTGLYDGGTNKFSTIALSFVYVGNNASYTSTASGRDQNFTNVNIHDNNVILTSTSVNSRLVTMYNVSGWLRNNKLQYTATNRIDQPCVLIDTPRGIEISGNSLVIDTVTGTIGGASAALSLTSNLSAVVSERSANIHDNELDCANVSYGYNQGLGTWNTANDEIIFHHNRFKNNPAVAHIKEFLGTSDGTNGYKKVDLGGTNGSQLLAVATGYTFNTGLKIAGTKSKPVFRLAFSTTEGGNQESIGLTSESASNLVGLGLAGINAATGEVLVRTGANGVSQSFNGGTFLPSPRATGYLYMWAGI